ncbi:MAG TPA: glycosyltransferase [Sphingomicrobium sp.]|nr:glycosyltransferase [Sphingomicrobium sp.]
MSRKTSTSIPPVTIVVEWENAIDVEDIWTTRAMQGFERELARAAPKMAGKPKVTYLYDRHSVDPGVIEKALAEHAPRIRKLADIEILPTDGLTYYKLKNFGISRATTDISVMLDSDAAPQHGWLENLVAPFADPEIMAVGGFTDLGYEDFLSKTFALSWIFNLPEEREKTVKRAKIHANNCAVRTEFFNANPFPDLPAFKKQCGFWLRDLSARGHKYVRTADAMTVHAPHPGYRFLVWRAWTMGLDRDYQAFQTYSHSRFTRVVYAFDFFGKKVGKSWARIIKKGKLVALPVWQRPASMLVTLGFYGICLAGEITSAMTRDFEPLPKPGVPRSKRASAAHRVAA